VTGGEEEEEGGGEDVERFDRLLFQLALAKYSSNYGIT